MSDFDITQINTAFSDLRSVAGPHVRPPGFAAARATAKRRRTTRIAALSIFVAGLLAIPIATLGSPNRADPDPMNTPSPSITDGPAPLPTGSPNPSFGPQPTPTLTPKGPANLAYSGVWVIHGDTLDISLPKSTAISFPVGIRVWTKGKSGPMTSAKLIIDVSKIVSKVDIVGMPGSCSRAGGTITCDYGTLNPGYHMKNMTLKAKAGVTPGRIGTVTVRATGSEPSFASQTGSGGVYVDSAEQMAQMKTTTTLSSGKVGGTFTATITARNDGPHTQPWMEYRTNTTGVELVSGTGCTTQAPQIVCRIENIAVGASKTLKVTLKILSCVPDNEWVVRDVYPAIPAPIGYRNGNMTRPNLNVTGC